MSGESSTYDKKSLRKLTGRSPDWAGLARHAVAFANARGAVIDVGIGDDADQPPAEQVVAPHLPDLIRRRVRELMVNVDLLADRERKSRRYRLGD